MKLDIKVDLKEIAKRTEGFTGAELKALATEAGYNAIRNNKTKISQKYFLDSIIKIKTGAKKYEPLSSSFS